MNKENKKSFRLPLRACLLYTIIVSLILTGVTFSKHITKTTGGAVARSASIEELVINESGDFVSDNTMVIIPGNPLSYKAEVKFTGCEASTYLFSEMRVSDDWVQRGSGKEYFIEKSNVETISFTISDDWTYLKSEDGNYIFYTEIAPNTSFTGSMLKGDSINISRYIQKDMITEMTGIYIKFKAVVVQSNEFSSPEVAWNSFNN